MKDKYYNWWREEYEIIPDDKERAIKYMDNMSDLDDAALEYFNNLNLKELSDYQRLLCRYSFMDGYSYGRTKREPENISWFESFPLEIRYLYYMAGGFILGILVSWLF